ncbi:TPA: DUF645 family protein [Vibrio cholerae]|nr:DUF645 family protein [Vibrio cholerae]
MVERVESSAVSKSSNHRCYLALLCRGLLTFWQPMSQLLAFDVCLNDAFA